MPVSSATFATALAAEVVKLDLLDQLPGDAAHARAKALRRPLEGVRATAAKLSEASRHIPLTDAAWKASLEDTNVEALWAELEVAADRLLAAARDAGATVGRGLPRAAWRFERAFATFAERIEPLGWFGPADSAAAHATEQLAAAACAFAIELLVAVGEGESRATVQQRLHDVVEALGLLRPAAEPGAHEDAVAAVEATFGPMPRPIAAARGRMSTSRLLAAHYRTRLGELQTRVKALTAHLGPEAVPWWASVYAAEQLVCAPVPSLAQLTARRLADAIAACEASDPVRAAVALRTITTRLNRFAQSERRTIEALHELARARSPSDRARYLLSAYEAAAEGQLRWWGWAVACLLGRADSERAPELGTVRQTLNGARQPLAHDLAAVLEPSWRNVFAHHDFEFDHARGVIVDDQSEIDPAVVERTLARARSLVSGLRAGRIIALASLSQLHRRMHPDDEIGVHAAGREQAVEWRLGASGLWVHDLIREGNTLRVELDELRPEAVNPCLHALSLIPKFDDEIDRLQVTVAAIARPVIDVPRQVLDATYVLYEQAFESFTAMPPATFMPTLAWSRLEVETPEQSAASSTWLLTNEAVKLLEERFETASEGNAEARRELWLHLDLLASSAITTFATLPEGSARDHDMLPRTLGEGAKLARRLASGDGASAAGLWEIWGQLEDELDFENPVPVLPTLDPTPLAD